MDKDNHQDDVVKNAATVQFFSRVGLFRHGEMDNSGYALQVFRRHFERSEFSKKEGGFVALELGPGDSFVSAIIAKAYGASRCYMVDAGHFAVDDINNRILNKNLGIGLDG